MVESMLSTPPSALDEPCSERPTLAAVARAANVSLATASYAVRGDPKISGATRQRICAIAKRIGYTPNPELGRLMFMLRERHRPQIKATLALLALKGRSNTANEFGRGLMRGMRERASALGFALDALEVDPAKMGRARLTQILLARRARRDSGAAGRGGRLSRLARVGAVFRCGGDESSCGRRSWRG
ncbi:MAG: LacI family DNA-binding transcriptional regulator [Nocardioides sp.]